jgi:hypothetical protein
LDVGGAVAFVRHGCFAVCLLSLGSLFVGVWILWRGIPNLNDIKPSQAQKRGTARTGPKH